MFRCFAASALKFFKILQHSEENWKSFLRFTFASYILHMMPSEQPLTWHFDTPGLWRQESQRSTESKAFWKDNSDLLQNTGVTMCSELSQRTEGKSTFCFSKIVSLVLSLQPARWTELYIPIICALSQIRQAEDDDASSRSCHGRAVRVITVTSGYCLATTQEKVCAL